MEAAIRLIVRLMLVLLGVAEAASAQSVPVSDPLADYFRVLEISGAGAPAASFARPTTLSPEWLQSLGTHPWMERAEREVGMTGASAGAGAADALDAEPGGIGIRATGARLRTFVNTAHPAGFNDDAVWQGRGLSLGLDAGVELRWKALTARLHPTVTYAQNDDFTLAPAHWPDLEEFAYPWRVIDLPQRFGTESYSTAGWGESELRVDVRGVSFGVSNRSRWWGPGIRNAILMSNNAPGFPHGFIGTRRPVDVGPASLEAFYLYGALEESGWFERASVATGRFVTGLVVSLSPDWPRGLSLGVGRLLYGFVPDSGHTLADVLLPLQGFRKKARATPGNPLGDDEEDQLLSFFARWVLPGSGFETYLEWTRTDHAWDFRDFVTEPEHSQGRTFGLRHSTSLADGRLLVLGVEMTDLARTTTSRVRESPTFYEHWIVEPGYTHHGQLMGASVGPGGSAQSITTDLYARWGRAGLALERRVHDNDAYYFKASRGEVDWCCHDVSFSAGPRLLLFRDDFEVDARATFTRGLNRYFQRGNDVSNVNLSLSARWRPGTAGRANPER